MIIDRIKALFNFIEFLHSNIDNFKGYDILINELYSLDKERNKLNPRINFVDKLKYDEIQAQIKDKFEVINKEIIQQIQDKSNELNICDWNETNTLWNYNIEEINKLKENFNLDAIPEILRYKNKYLEFRTKTNCDYFQTFFFSDLDKILKVLFDFFKESVENEFEAFETKSIQVNDVSEAISLLNKGHIKFIIPTPNTNIKQRLSKSLSDINFFQIYFKINNNKEFNNDSFIKPENWDNLKDIFFTQRMEKYKSSYTQNEKIKLEIEDLENLTINKTDYKILKERYKEYLKNKQNLPQQTISSKPDEDYKNRILFKVGLLFAKGEMNKYFTVNSKNKTVMNDEYTAPKIANELRHPNYNKYILASINNYLNKENGNKNIFNSFDMMTKIISHCEAENIPVDAYFKSRLPKE